MKINQTSDWVILIISRSKYEENRYQYPLINYSHITYRYLTFTKVISACGEQPPPWEQHKYKKV
jgi:hypothetical protein